MRRTVDRAEKNHQKVKCITSFGKYKLDFVQWKNFLIGSVYKESAAQNKYDV